MKKKFSSQNIDDLIIGIEIIIKNRCSLLDSDRKLLEETIDILTEFKQKLHKSDSADLLLLVKVAELIARFFV